MLPLYESLFIIVSLHNMSALCKLTYHVCTMQIYESIKIELKPMVQSKHLGVSSCSCIALCYLQKKRKNLKFLRDKKHSKTFKCQ